MRALIAISLLSMLMTGCARRSCEEVTADREALLEEHQACTVDTDCAVYNADALLGSASESCGVIALRADSSNAYADEETALAEEASASCDEDDDMGESLGKGIGNAVGCAVASAFISDDPADYQAACTEGICEAVLVIR